MPLTTPFSFQLYSARNFPPPDAQLATIAKHGFTNVETFGPWYEDVGRSKALFDKHKLTSASGHYALALIDAEPDKVLALARALGQSIIIAPYLMPDERPKDRAGYQALGARLAKAAALFKGHGLRFAWHNHDFEFVALPDGSYPIEHLIHGDVLLEADLAWMVRAKADPAVWVKRYAGRMPLVHVKDIAPVGEKSDEDGWADVGTGILRWSMLWPLCVASGAEIMVAEHDNPKDFDRFARVTGAAMQTYAKGSR
jgi:sugar phosphate isomerase/epimerase